MGDEPVTKQDLANFKDFVVSQLTASAAALSASNSLKEQSEIKFTHIGNERNFKFNGQVY